MWKHAMLYPALTASAHTDVYQLPLYVYLVLRVVYIKFVPIPCPLVNRDLTLRRLFSAIQVRASECGFF